MLGRYFLVDLSKENICQNEEKSVYRDFRVARWTHFQQKMSQTHSTRWCTLIPGWSNQNLNKIFLLCLAMAGPNSWAIFPYYLSNSRVCSSKDQSSSTWTPEHPTKKNTQIRLSLAYTADMAMLPRTQGKAATSGEFYQKQIFWQIVGYRESRSANYFCRFFDKSWSQSFSHDI